MDNLNLIHPGTVFRCVHETDAVTTIGKEALTRRHPFQNSPLALAGVTARLSQRWKRLAGAGERLVSRELLWFAEAALENMSHAAEIEQCYAWAEEMQDRDPDSPTFGNFRWYRANPRPMDKNAVQFCMSTATVTWVHYRDRLTPAARASLERMMRFGAEGLKRHRVGPDYTNIYLEKTWNVIGVGQAMDMPELRKGTADK